MSEKFALEIAITLAVAVSLMVSSSKRKTLPTKKANKIASPLSFIAILVLIITFVYALFDTFKR